MRYKDYERLQKQVDKAEKAATELSDALAEGIRVGMGAMREDSSKMERDRDLDRLVNKMGWVSELANVSRKVIGSMKEIELEDMRDHTK